jgi:hypothetical protein
MPEASWPRQVAGVLQAAGRGREGEGRGGLLPGRHRYLAGDAAVVALGAMLVAPLDHLVAEENSWSIGS